MLSKNRRIPRGEFSKIFSDSKRYNSDNLLLYIAKTNKSGPSKFSFSVSKKVCKKAVDRNKYRRRGYAIITKRINQIEPGYLCFFSLKNFSGGATFKILEEQITDLLRKASVII